MPVGRLDQSDRGLPKIRWNETAVFFETEHLGDQLEIFDTTSKEAERIERWREDSCTSGRDGIVSRLECKDAGIGSWADNTTTGLRP